MNALNFAPAMSATAAREAIRLSGFSARPEADAPAAEYRPQPCPQPQARHTPTAEAAEIARRMGDAIRRGIDARHGARVWGVALVPAELAAAFALAPVPRVDGRATLQAIRDAREADAFALGRGAF